MPTRKKVNASSIRTKEQYEKAKKSGVEIVFDKPYPTARNKRGTTKKK